MPWRQGAGRVGDRVDKCAGEVRGREGEGGGCLPAGEEECRDGGAGAAGADTGRRGRGREGGKEGGKHDGMDGEGIGTEGVRKCVPTGEEECRDGEADTCEEGEGMWRQMGWERTEGLRRVGA